MQAYRSSSLRRSTLTLRKPEPTGVVVGPLMPTPVRLIDSSVRSGKGLPSSAYTSSPAGCSSQANSTPVASSTRRVASASSGPVPSPGMKVTSWDMVLFLESGARKAISGRLPGLCHHCPHHVRVWVLRATDAGPWHPHRREHVLVPGAVPVHLLAVRAVRGPARQPDRGLHGRGGRVAAVLRLDRAARARARAGR